MQQQGKDVCIQGKSGRSNSICNPKCAAKHTTFIPLQKTLHKYRLWRIISPLFFSVQPVEHCPILALRVGNIMCSLFLATEQMLEAEDVCISLLWAEQP